MKLIPIIRENNSNAQKEIFELMDFLDLLDIYRLQNPEVCQYTWQAHIHNVFKQARLDYFLVSSDLIAFVDHTETQAGYRSDHLNEYYFFRSLEGTRVLEI